MGSRRVARTAYVDAHVGARIRERRLYLGLSQTGPAEPMGLSFQQIQKSECGADWIGVSWLYQIARVLDVPMMFFLRAAGSQIEQAGPIG